MSITMPGYPPLTDGMGKPDDNLVKHVKASRSHDAAWYY
jgi:hypothetical protein